MKVDVLNPAQQEVLDALGAALRDRPSFDGELRHHLRGGLDKGLAPHVEALGCTADEPLFLNKHKVAAIHGCEVRMLGEEGMPFAWSVPTARGTVAHKAIELSVHMRRPLTPLELVDEALARLTETEQSLGEWLQGLSEAERGELRAEANDRVSKFVECWPPLKVGWRPVTESRLRADLCADRVVLLGKVDLSLGHAQGPVAGKVLVDLKTGGFSPSHLDDLRFYALVETLRLGTPPRRVATYYLDSGRFVPADVTVAALEAALDRTVEAVARLAELRTGGRVPLARPGPTCRWCPLLVGCDPGRTHLDEHTDT
jgi:hypothetical protein